MERKPENGLAEETTPRVEAGLDPCQCTMGSVVHDEGIGGSSNSTTSGGAHSHLCVWRGWHSWQNSMLSSRMVSSWRSMSVWKKSASVVTTESALIVTVFTCFFGASVFSSVRLIALW